MENLKKDIKVFESEITDVVNQYIDNEGEYTDNVQMEINPMTLEVALVDPETDIPDRDYYPIMDLIKMSTSAPGQWEPDADAISQVAADYIIVA